MPDLDLEPHEFRPTGRPRVWGKRLVIQFAIAALCIEGVMVWVFLQRPDVLGSMELAVVAMLTWPPMILLGAALGHLVPAIFFRDDKQD